MPWHHQVLDLAIRRSSRLIMRSCSWRLCTCSRFCWSSTRRTSRHVSSTARLSLRCSSSIASSTRSFFLCSGQPCAFRLFSGRSSDLQARGAYGEQPPQGSPSLTKHGVTFQYRAFGRGGVRGERVNKGELEKREEERRKVREEG